ncbi:MAG: response regulator [Cyclobacteriaceae bacterium]
MQILIIDDNLFDRDLVIRALKSVPGLVFDHAVNFVEFKQKYSPNKYAAILSDYNLRGALGTDIFLYVKELEPDIPFIIISGALGEERAVEILRMGVTDYILKDNLTRLPLVLSRALKEAETQKAKNEGHQKLIESEEKFRKIFESISDVYFQTDKNGIYTVVSPSCFHMTGYQPNELIGKRAGCLSKNPEDGVTLFSKILPKEKKVTNFEIIITGKNGKTIIASANISLIVDENGNPSGAQGIYRDITEKKKQDEALMQAQLASRTKSQFLANMSHEIRTPMNAIIGLSHLALKTDLTAKQADYLKKILGSSESLLRIINDILDFSKIEAGKLTLEEVHFDLEEVFQKLADVITYKAHGKGLEIAFGISSDLPTHLVGDPVRLEQVLSNLCSNAVKFTNAGEVVVKAGLAEDYGDSVRLQFEVTDTGIGISKKQLSKLFEPFTQADDSIASLYGGTGLGLSIIKRLVELMDGTVWVKSEPGAGTAFYFTVRLRKQEQQRIIPVPSVDLRKLSVLLVDDNKSAQKILKEALESFSFEVVAADSGIEAIHFLKNNYDHQPVKLVLMDWNMPEMDGLRAAEIIRQDKQLKDVRIIMMCTSYASDELYQKTEAMGLSGILIKPIRYSQLYDTIMRAFDIGVIMQPEKERAGIQTAVMPENRGHILLVEDNEINQQVVSELLHVLGFTVDIADNGAEALNKIKESGSPSRYNLVLMDLQMPIMGGYKATEEILKLEGYKNLPIIALTADAIAGVREKCLGVGMMDFITKPINPNQLSEVVHKWI